MAVWFKTFWSLEPPFLETFFFTQCFLTISNFPKLVATVAARVARSHIDIHIMWFYRSSLSSGSKSSFVLTSMVLDQVYWMSPSSMMPTRGCAKWFCLFELLFQRAWKTKAMYCHRQGTKCKGFHCYYCQRVVIYGFCFLNYCISLQ